MSVLVFLAIINIVIVKTCIKPFPWPIDCDRDKYRKSIKKEEGNIKETKMK